MPTTQSSRRPAGVSRRSRLLRRAGVGAALLVALAASPAVAAEPAVTVEMTNRLEFDPEHVTVQAGETIRWENTSHLVHTVTTDPELAQVDAHVQLPEGAEAFDSGDVEPGRSFERTFDVPGEYHYFCQPHEAAGMTGRITVEE